MIYFKIFEITDFDVEVDSFDLPEEHEYLDGDINEGYLYVFPGTIEAKTMVKYLYEKKDPSVAGGYFRSGKYFVDQLKISIIATPSAYEMLYFASIRNPKYLVGWETYTGFQFRWLQDVLPYPSRIRWLNERVDLTLETAPYHNIKLKMQDDFLKNFRYNLATINTSVLN